MSRSNPQPSDFNVLNKNIKSNKHKWFGFEKGNFAYQYDFYNTPGNTLVRSGTRTGKTTGVVKPKIDMNTRINDYDKKPNMVIGDPKGELFDDMAKICEARGYKVLSLNLKEPSFTNTHCFNPLKIVYDEYKKEFDKISHKLDINLIKQQAHPLKEYYHQLENNLTQQEKDSYSFEPAIKLLESVANVFIPIEDSGSGDKFFPRAAQGWFISIAYYLLEICILDNDPNKFSIYGIVTYLQTDEAFNDGERSWIDKDGQVQNGEEVGFKIILDHLPQYHYSVVTYVKAVGKQAMTFKTDVIGHLKLFSGVAKKITSYNNIDLRELIEGDQPFIWFLITPDYENYFNPIITLIIDQLYRLMAETADANDSKKLKRYIEIILDEFANIPKVTDIGNKLSVCLSRGISFTLIIQNTSQIIDKYGQHVKNIIFANSLNSMFLGSIYSEDQKEWSEEVGMTTKLVETDQVGSGNKLDWRPEKVPLVTPEELQKQKLFEAYVKIKGMSPLKTHLIPSFVYMNYEKTTPQEFYANKHLPHVNSQPSDLLYDRMLNPFNNQSYYG